MSASHECSDAAASAMVPGALDAMKVEAEAEERRKRYEAAEGDKLNLGEEGCYVSVGMGWWGLE